MDTPNGSPVSLATYLMAGITLLLVGVIIGVFTDPYLSASLSNTKKGYQSGFTAARTLVESRLGDILKVPNDIRTLSGTVISVGDGSLILHIQPISIFGDPAEILDRTVLVTASTSIVTSLENKSFKENYDNFMKTIESSSSSASGILKPEVTPPTQFKLTIADLKSIKVGDSLTVRALENIKLKNEFEASEIEINIVP